MKDSLSSMTVLRKLTDNPLLHALSLQDKDEETAAEFLFTVYKCGCEEHLLTYIQELILKDENPFSVGCATKETISDLLKNAFQRDLKIIYEAVSAACRKFGLKNGDIKLPFTEDLAETTTNLRQFYKQFGYGNFIRNLVFLYQNGSLVPIQTSVHSSLNDLKDYEAEKKQIENNISGFIQGLPALNMLLYGDKGTGKSSTVRAMAAKYFESGLRIIELDEQSVTQINEIRQNIAHIPLKFILFIDDLSLNSDDVRIPTIKASLEGSFANEHNNSIVVATSNRRHLIKENYSDRQDAVHADDSMNEQLSLADRFGLTVLFSSTNKAQYLSIVRQLAEDKKITMQINQLDALAERWALLKGGRSPRRAKQFIELLHSMLSRGLTPDF